MFSNFFAQYLGVLVTTFGISLGDQERSILQIYELKDVPKYKLKVGNKDSYLTEKDLHKPIKYFANLRSSDYVRETTEPTIDMEAIRALEQSIDTHLAKQDKTVLDDKRLLHPDSYRTVENRDYTRGSRIFRPWIGLASDKKARTHELVEKLADLLEKEDGNTRNNFEHIHIFEPGSEVTEEAPIKIRDQILL